MGTVIRRSRPAASRRIFVLGGLAVAAWPDIPKAALAEPRLPERGLKDFVPTSLPHCPAPRPPLTQFRPDDRYWAEEIAAILAFEAYEDGRACLHRHPASRQEQMDLMRSAMGKGYDRLRGRRFKFHLDPFL